jgi:hypothetical protein
VYTIYSVSEIPQSVDVKWMEVLDGEDARNILASQGYTTGWFYNRKNAKRLFVDKREYEKINGEQNP